MVKRLAIAALLGIVFLASADPSLARRVVVRRHVVRRGPVRRTVVVVRPGHPIHRPLRTVYVHPVRGVVRVSTVAYLPLVVWAPRVVARPVTDEIVWQDKETIDREDDWTEFTLNSGSRGEQLLLEVADGRVQFDFVEVVFENGDTQVVDFSQKAEGPGVYSLLDFRDGRMVDHVRVFARAKTDEATVALLMRK